DRAGEGRPPLLARDPAPAREPVDSLVRVAPDDAAGHDRERERIAPGVVRGTVDRASALARLVDAGERGVVLVRVADRELDSAGPRAAADDDPRPRLLQRLRPRVALLGPVAVDLAELALELVEALARRRERKAVGLVLGLVPARADAELDAPARNVIDGGGVLRQHGPRPEGDRRHESAEPDARRRDGERGERRPSVE